MLPHHYKCNSWCFLSKQALHGWQCLFKAVMPLMGFLNNWFVILLLFPSLKYFQWLLATSAILVQISTSHFLRKSWKEIPTFVAWRLKTTNHKGNMHNIWTSKCYVIYRRQKRGKLLFPHWLNLQTLALHFQAVLFTVWTEHWWG